MRLKTKDGGWNPYFAGALVGILAILSVYATTALMGKTNYLGASTTFVRAVGFVEQVFASEHVAQNAYFAATKIKVDWQFMLVIGIFLGALISSLTDKSFKIEKVPPIWQERFGSSVTKRAVGAFLGGIVAMIGARLADGCPSGHGLSGVMQLSVSSFVALILFFVAGAVTAALVYKRRAS
ncbi:MAG TPA: YeeE/YedE thiosulfate transporter family protein [Smithellaceae bacterium]|nr:YeeE/YedE thiosulfate transporter family protein [Smithellaceae bacterium]